MLQQVLERDRGYESLDSEPRRIPGKAHVGEIDNFSGRANYDIGVADVGASNVRYMTMELVDGRQASAKIRDEAVERRDLLAWLAEAYALAGEADLAIERFDISVTRGFTPWPSFAHQHRRIDNAATRVLKRSSSERV